jgi:hypothetical protein
MKTLPKATWPVAAVLFALFLAYSTAYAHERRMVGQYQFIVGFFVEPAYEGQKNGVDLRVSIPAEEEGGEAAPVEGVEETLQVEVTHVPSGVSRVMELRSIFGDPGHYTNDWVPTAPGQYRFRFFGTIEELEVDEVFESGEGRFGDILTGEDLHFPEEVPEAREMESAVRGAQTTADEALDAASQVEDAAASARTMATIGLILGAVGTVAGVGGVAMAMRRQ